MIPVAAVATALTLLLIVILYQKPARHLPPGPPKVPFFGNLFQVTSLRPHPQVCISCSNLLSKTDFNSVPRLGKEVWTHLSPTAWTPEHDRSQLR